MDWKINWKKNACSYLLWLLYTAAVSLGMAGLLSASLEHWGYPGVYVIPAMGVFYLIAGLLVLVAHRLAVRIRGRRQVGETDDDSHEEDQNPELVWAVVEGIFLVALLAVGILLRVGQMQQTVGTEADMAYFEAAMVAQGNQVPQVVHGATYIYLELLHFVFSLFGNKFLAAAWLQVVLQCLAGVLLYFAVRRLAGRVAAVSVLFFLLLSSVTVKKAAELSPEALFLALYGLALWFMAAVLGKKGSHAVLSVLAGLLIGVCCYFDLSAVTLLVFPFGLATVEKGGRAFLLCLFRLLGAAAGWCAAICVDALLSGKQIPGVMVAWLELYRPGSFSPGQGVLPVFTEVFSGERFSVMEQLSTDTQLSLHSAGLLFGFLVFGIFSFWCIRKRERRSVWILGGAVLLLLQGFQMLTPQLDGSICFYVYLTVLAGIGIADIFVTFPGQAENVEAVMEAVSENTGRQSEEPGVFLDADMEEGSYFGGTQAVAEGETPEAEVPKTKLLKTEMPETEPTDLEPVDLEPLKKEPPQPASKSPEIHFLENPLPLPKKHQTKVMDYRIKELPEGDFDYAVEEDDDFDL